MNGTTQGPAQAKAKPGSNGSDEGQGTALARIQNYMDAPIVRQRFAQVMGERGASTYIASTLIAVAESGHLQQCDPKSIYTSSLRAATLRLSCDPGIGQAYLVPYKGQAKLIIGYKGLHDLAVRTNRYRYINVAPIYEGQVPFENPISGLHTRIDGVKRSAKIIGWLGAFEMLNGYAKTLYMTVEEITEHAAHYSPSYTQPTSPWNDPVERPKMERKTVLRLLLKRWGYIDPADSAVITEMEAEDTGADVVDAEIQQLTSTLDIAAADIEPPSMPPSPRESLEQLGFDVADNPDPVPPAAWKAWDDLCKAADQYGVQHSNPANRDQVVMADLRVEFNRLQAQVAAFRKAGVKPVH